MSTSPTPQLATDIIIRLTDHPGSDVVMIQRQNPPYGWALPGGFVDVGESTARAAQRETLEETGLTVRLTHLLDVYSDPGRDPRGHAVSVVYVAEAEGTPEARSDAAAVQVFSLDELPRQIAFDHEKILADYQAFISGRREAIRL